MAKLRMAHASRLSQFLPFFSLEVFPYYLYSNLRQEFSFNFLPLNNWKYQYPDQYQYHYYTLYSSLRYIAYTMLHCNLGAVQKQHQPKEGQGEGGVWRL